jgi:uncharacterized protein YmfQ (DUF2313 family)
MNQLLSMLDLGSIFETDLEIEADHLDNAETSAELLLQEFFPESSALLLSDWERALGIVPADGASTAQRRLEIAAKDGATGGLSKAYFEQLAGGLGFSIGSPGDADPHLRLRDGLYPPFRSDYAQADVDKIYDQGSGYSQYTLVVSGTSVESNTVLQELFNKLKPAFTEVIFINE